MFNENLKSIPKSSIKSDYVFRFTKTKVDDLIIFPAKYFTPEHINLVKSDYNKSLLIDLSTKFDILYLASVHINELLYKTLNYQCIEEFAQRYFYKMNNTPNDHQENISCLDQYQCNKCNQSVGNHVIVGYLAKNLHYNINPSKLFSDYGFIACVSEDYIVIKNSSRIGIFTYKELIEYISKENFNYSSKYQISNTSNTHHDDNNISNHQQIKESIDELSTEKLKEIIKSQHKLIIRQGEAIDTVLEKLAGLYNILNKR